MVIGNRRKRAARALRSVLAQTEIDQAEVLLLDAGSPGSEELIGSDHAAVRTINTNGTGTFGTLRALAIRESRAQIVAFVEDHVETEPSWLGGILRSFEGPWDAVGAEVHNANAKVGVSESIAVINYGLWTPPMEAGETSLLPGNNTSYRREVLLQYEDQLDDLMLSDTVLQWRMTRDGHRLYADPSISIQHLNPTTIRNAVTAEYVYHWAFSALRAQIFEWSAYRKIRYFLLSPIVPWLRFARVLKLVLRKWPDQFTSVLARSPAILLFLHAAVVGQNMGLLLGMRDSDKRFTDFELNSPRPAIG